MFGLRLCLIIGIGLSLSSGCAYFQPRLEANRLDAGLTLVLPGLEGPSVLDANVATGLVRAGVPTAVEIHDWTTGFAPMALIHLRSRWLHERQSRRLAEKIVAYHDAYPGRPIYIIGHSSGGAMAILTLERLPPDVQVTRVMLLSPALSPQYDLEPALSQTTGGIWNFYSGDDIGFLAAGTTLFGTLDGAWRPAAGCTGFRDSQGEIFGDLEVGSILPTNGNPRSLREYQWGPYLRQVGYRPEMILAGNPGTHIGWMTRSFGANYLAPLINVDFQ